jgi:hypothetical protein
LIPALPSPKHLHTTTPKTHWQLKYGNKKDFEGSSPSIYEDTTSKAFPPYPPPKRMSKCAPKHKTSCDGSFECEVETDVAAATSAL